MRGSAVCCLVARVPSAVRFLALLEVQLHLGARAPGVPEDFMLTVCEAEQVYARLAKSRTAAMTCVAEASGQPMPKHIVAASLAPRPANSMAWRRPRPSARRQEAGPRGGDLSVQR
jgi:hypothetical protein